MTQTQLLENMLEGMVTDQVKPTYHGLLNMIVIVSKERSDDIDNAISEYTNESGVLSDLIRRLGVIQDKYEL